MSNGDQFREQLEAYALGTLDAQERAALEAHLATGCMDCARALDEARWLVTQLAYAAPPAQPSDMLRGRLLQTIHADAAPAGTRASSAARIPAWLWAGVAALFLFTLYSGWQTNHLQREVKSVNERASAELQKRERLEQQLAMEKRAARILTDPASKKIMLPASDKDMPQLEAMWNPKLGLCIMGQKVPMPADNRAFQLWMIPKAPGSKPMASQMFWPDSDGKLWSLVVNPPEPMDDTKALAITEEPASGSSQPTSAPMWLGGLS